MTKCKGKKKKAILGLLTAAALLLGVCSGCATSEKIAESLSAKTVTGSGLITKNKIGVDENKIPTMESTVISGDFETIKAGSNYVKYKDETSAAWYNASNKTRKINLTISADGKSNLAETLRYALGLVERLPESTVSEEKPADASGK